MYLLPLAGSSSAVSRVAAALLRGEPAGDQQDDGRHDDPRADIDREFGRVGPIFGGVGHRHDHERQDDDRPRPQQRDQRQRAIADRGFEFPRMTQRAHLPFAFGRHVRGVFVALGAHRPMKPTPSRIAPISA